MNLQVSISSTGGECCLSSDIMNVGSGHKTSVIVVLEKTFIHLCNEWQL